MSEILISGAEILINGARVDVLKIDKVSSPLLLDRKLYLKALEVYRTSLNINDKFVSTRQHRKRVSDKYLKPYNVVLDFLDEEYFAITGDHIYTEDRYKSPEDINWEILPDAWIFGVMIENGGVKNLDKLDNKLYTDANNFGTCLYSKIYLELDEAICARSKLVRCINEIKASIPSFTI